MVSRIKWIDHKRQAAYQTFRACQTFDGSAISYFIPARYKIDPETFPILDDPGVYRKFSGFWKIASFWEQRQRPNHHIITFSSGRFCKFTFMQRAKTYIKLIVLAVFYLYSDT